MSLIFKENYRFEIFELNCAKRSLLRDGQRVALSPKAFEVLTYLVINPGRVVTKEELIQAVWPDSFVEEGNLAQQISSLRRAFADRAGLIATVPGRGYQFTAEVAQDATAVSALTPAADEVLVAGGDSEVVQTVRERTRIVVEQTSIIPAGTFGQEKASRGIRIVVWTAVGVVMLGIAGFAGWHLMRPRSYGHAAAVIADLDNTTGEGEFDHSLNRMLQIDLQQSPYFTVVGEGRARDVLKRMRQPDGVRISASLAREICQRLNGQVYLTPAIAKIGDDYLVTLEANDCVDGHSLGSGRQEASSKNAVLATLSSLTRSVRRDVGESRASLKHFDKPLFNSYTASLDALKAYSEATRLAYGGKYAESITLYRRAVELDPNFAAAYGDMASMYFNMGDDLHDREAVNKAYALRDSLNDYERFFIEYSYQNSVTGDLHAQLDTLRQRSATYPDDSLPVAALVNLETQVGDFNQAAEYSDRALDLQRRGNIHNGTTYDIAARAYHHANMPDKLRATCAEALQSKADSQGLHFTMLEFAAESGDSTGVEREIAWSRGKPDESRTLMVAALAALAGGEVRHADALFAEGTQAARRDKLEDILADYSDYYARMLVEVGLPEQATLLLKRQPPNGDPSGDRLFTEAEVGDSSTALAQVQREENANPSDAMMRAEIVPSVQAAIALRQGKPSEAITLLQADIPYERHDPTVPYLRGEAYLAAHQGAQAAAEFRKLADRPWLADPPSPLIALAHLGLARAYAIDGNSAASRSELQRLFAVWNHADAGLPILQRAQLEYQRIQ